MSETSEINYNELIYTENIDNKIIKDLNSQYGLRTINKKFYYLERNWLTDFITLL